MRKLFALCTLLAITAIPTSASAITGLYYGKVQGGANFFKGSNYYGTDFLLGPVGGIAVGYNFYGNILGEVEMSMRRNSAKSRNIDPVTGDNLGGNVVQTYCWMGNLYYEPNLCWIIKPFIGAGLGYEQIDRGPRDNPLATQKALRNGFAYQGMAGFYYGLCDARTDIGVEYRYHRYVGDHFYSNSVMLSFRQYL